MVRYIIFSRFQPDPFDRPSAIADLANRIAVRVRLECPKLRWMASLAIRDRSARVDIVEAHDPSEVMRAAMIMRSLGSDVTTDTVRGKRWAECLECH